MKQFNLTKAELAWLKRLENTVNAAPKSIGKKLAAYTIGGNDICIFHEETYQDKEDSNYHSKDVCKVVDESDSEVIRIIFPFSVWSTSG